MAKIPESLSPALNFKGSEILIVDDNEINREILERRLGKAGFQFRSAASGREALAMISNQTPDLVLLDWMMPKMDGMEVLRRIRESFSREELPVLMVTARTISENVVEAIQSGANDYLTKPMDFPIAMARINTHLALKKSFQELTKREKRFTMELEMARTISRAFLPKVFPPFTGYSAGLVYEPCFLLGGDFFDVVLFPNPDQVGFLFADVAGHGVAGGLLMAMFKALVNETVHNFAEPRKAFLKMNDRVAECFPEGSFATCFYAIIEGSTGSMTFLNASPDPVFVLRANGSIEMVCHGGTPLGLLPAEFLDEEDLVPRERSLEKGDTLLLFTDGLPDAVNVSRMRFSIDRIREHVNQLTPCDPNALVQGLLEAARTFAEGQAFDDDLMIFAFRRDP